MYYFTITEKSMARLNFKIISLNSRHKSLNWYRSLNYLDIIALNWWVFWFEIDLMIFVALWVYFSRIVINCELKIKSWFMDYVWIYVDLFELTWNLNKVHEITKICVDFLCCLISKTSKIYFVSFNIRDYKLIRRILNIK
jgi:predicted MPP superfamily phosphohydrolase